LKFFAYKWMPTAKEKVKPTGYNPEGNVSRGDFPFLGLQVTATWIAEKVANIKDAAVMALDPQLVMREATGRLQFHYRVRQTVQSPGYTVKFGNAPECLPGEFSTRKARDVISCSCGGYRGMPSGLDRLCKHCGAVLLCCIKKHKEQYPRVENAETTGSTQSSGARSVPGPPTDAAPIKEEGGASTLIVPALPKKKTREVIDYRFMNQRVALASPAPESGAGPSAASSSLAIEDREASGWGARSAQIKALLSGTSFVMPPGAMTVVAMVGAVDAQKLAVHLATIATAEIFLTAYTFDLMTLCSALIAATNRGVDVTVCVDRQHTYTGSTQAMKTRMQQLSDAGVHVWLASGVNGGIQHSKTVTAGDLCLMGSTNWTDAGAKNTEMSVLLALTDAGQSAVREWRTEILARAQDFKVYSPPAMTQSQLDKYRTARRFSIARSRSVGANNADT